MSTLGNSNWKKYFSYLVVFIVWVGLFLLVFGLPVFFPAYAGFVTYLFMVFVGVLFGILFIVSVTRITLNKSRYLSKIQEPYLIQLPWNYWVYQLLATIMGGLILSFFLITFFLPQAYPLFIHVIFLTLGLFQSQTKFDNGVRYQLPFFSYRYF